jgi:GNAT superfamily N-acetyltransferase
MKPDDRAHVREIPAGSTRAAYAAMRELRPHVDDPEEFVRRVDDLQRPQGYRLAGVFLDGLEDAVAAAGFWVSDNLVSGRFMYVDDLVTMEAHRRRGYGRLLLEWSIEEARRLGCAQFHLDSATHRHGAHRLYLTAGMDITAFHFGLNLSSADAD